MDGCLEYHIMRIGLLSDTHGHVAHTLQAVDIFLDRGIQTVLHAGDIGSTQIVEALAGLTAHFVFGNCDYDRDLLRFAIREFGLTCHEEFGDISLSNRRIALIHSHDTSRFLQTCQCGDFDLVCYGHTHRAEMHHSGPTTIVNPGALYRAHPHRVAIADLETLQIEFIDL